MDNARDPFIPEERQLEEMLEQLKPKPTARLYRLVQSAPWTKATESARKKQMRSRINSQSYTWGLVILVFLLALLSIAFIPSVRALARQIIFSFIFEPSNQLEVQVTLTNPDDLYSYADIANFPQSVEAAEQAAGFPVKQLTSLPQGLALIGGRFESKYHSVTLLYQGDDYQIFLTQRPLGAGADVFSIGSDAHVEQVMVGDIQAEYVRGGWKAVSTQEVSSQAQPTSTFNIYAVWDESLPQSTLRWQAGGYALELRSLGERSPSQEQLIMLANGLK